jgi:hypothetical protein
MDRIGPGERPAGQPPVPTNAVRSAAGFSTGPPLDIRDRRLPFSARIDSHRSLDRIPTQRGLVQLAVPGDGNCALHALLSSFLLDHGELAWLRIHRPREAYNLPPPFHPQLLPDLPVIGEYDDVRAYLEWVRHRTRQTGEPVTAADHADLELHLLYGAIHYYELFTYCRRTAANLRSALVEFTRLDPLDAHHEQELTGHLDDANADPNALPGWCDDTDLQVLVNLWGLRLFIHSSNPEVPFSFRLPTYRDPAEEAPLMVVNEEGDVFLEHNWLTDAEPGEEEEDEFFAWRLHDLLTVHIDWNPGHFAGWVPRAPFEVEEPSPQDQLEMLLALVKWPMIRSCSAGPNARDNSGRE